MSRNVDRLSDILDLPTLLASAINSSTAQGASGNTSYASALDLHSHIKRLHLLYKDSELVQSIYSQAEEAMRGMTANLIMSLRGQSLKLAAGIRTVGWLRRVAPELTDGARVLRSSLCSKAYSPPQTALMQKTFEFNSNLSTSRAFFLSELLPRKTLSKHCPLLLLHFLRILWDF